jgi:hypothetical protein
MTSPLHGLMTVASSQWPATPLRGYPHGVACKGQDPMVSPTPSLPPEFRLFSDVLAAPVLMQCLPRVLPAYVGEPVRKV